MRLSIDKRDPGYRYDLARVRCKIILDGVEQDSAVTADEEEGLVVRFVRGPDGFFKTEGDAFVTETVRGKVEVVLLAEDGSNLKDPKVTAEVAPEGIQVMVYSRVDPRSIRRIKMPAEVFQVPRRLLNRELERFAEEAAGHLIGQHGDWFEPKDVARAAVEALGALIDA